MNFKIIITFFVIATQLFALSQNDLSGVWQGIMVENGRLNEQAVLVYAEFEISDNKISGRTRNEIFNSELFSVKKITGQIDQNNIAFDEIVIEKKSSSTKVNWCTLFANLKYNDSTGYLVGTYGSKACKNSSGKIILQKIHKVKLSASAESPMSHNWFPKLLNNLKKGYPAPDIMEQNRKTFKFEPIYFEYDKADLKPEHIVYLKKMAIIVDGHTDLRIKVTGHTDGDGSDSYNMELSKNRAESILNFFKSIGISPDKIVIDFKGESEPVDSNKTDDGKQKNRRVDFNFI